MRVDVDVDVNIINILTAKSLGIAGLEKTPWGHVLWLPVIEQDWPYSRRTTWETDLCLNTALSAPQQQKIEIELGSPFQLFLP